MTAAAGQPAPAFVLPGYGIGYGQFALDSDSGAYLLAHLPELPDPILRVNAWLALWEAMLTGQVSPEALIELVTRALPEEYQELTIQRILAYLKKAYWRFLRPERRTALALELEALGWHLLEQTPTATLKAAYFKAFRSIVLTEPGLDTLLAVWQQKRTVPKLTFSEEDYVQMSQTLALRNPSEAPQILEQQQARITNPDRAARFAFVRPALSADPAVRDAFFASLKDPRNRRPEPWVIEAHPLRAEASEAYILPSLELLEEFNEPATSSSPSSGWTPH